MANTPSIYDTDLGQNDANYTSLSPIGFLKRSAFVYPNKTAVIHGNLKFSYKEFYTRARRLASALSKRGIGKGDTVSVMAPNVPALLEAHYGVLMVGAVLNAINTRLDGPTVGFILNHGESKVLIADRMFSPVTKVALSDLGREIQVIDIDDPMDQSGELIGEKDYEALLDEGDPDFDWQPLSSEWDAVSLNYTSGTTGNPKGVVYHSRGAYLNALGNLISFGLTSDTVYLWTLPMFHCNGWTFPWAVTAVSGTHVCLRAVDPKLIFPSIRDNKVTHMCGAPIVLTMLIHAPDADKCAFPQIVDIATGGAAPASSTIVGMEEMGFKVMHLYGMTECYGPSSICAYQDEWDDLSTEDRAGKMARQGVKMVTLDEQRVANTDTMEDVPADGKTIGELMLRGNTVMKGYLKNPPTTAEAFEGGWLHTGDLAVQYPDGYVEIKDRAKDIIISGGENISSLEVEEVLFRHPDIMEAAVVAAPSDKWGETPCAFVTPIAGAESRINAEEIISFCKEHMAKFKAPSLIEFGPLPKTSTGKIQKFVLRDRAKELG